MIPNNPNQQERSNASVPDEDVAEGTTTIGITAGDSVVLATEQRASMGNLVASKTAKKIYQVTDDAALTISGGVGDGQNLAKTLKVEANLYEMRRGKPMTMTYLFRVVPILGGVDDEGAHVFSLDPAGGVMEEEYVSTGSGSVIAYGVLEDGYESDIELEDAKRLALRGLESAMERDTASGNGILLAEITPEEGFRQLEDDEIEAVADDL